MRGYNENPLTIPAMLTRTPALMHLLLIVLLLAQSTAASVVAPINGQHAAVISLRSAVESSVNIHQSKNGLNTEEFRKFGSMISDISEDDVESPKSAPRPNLKSALKLSVAKVEMNTFTGPKVEFHWKPEKQGAKKVTMCGSWTGWKDHYNLTLNADTGRYEALVDEIPEGEHQFKVPNRIFAFPSCRSSLIVYSSLLTIAGSATTRTRFQTTRTATPTT
jgi:hypothetical protein